MSDENKSSFTAPVGERRYSLREMIKEVTQERRDSHFGRQLVDSTEIDKMFSKRKRKLKKKKST